MGSSIIPDKDQTGSPIFGSQTFSSKFVGSKKLFARNHGIKHVCAIGDNTIEFPCPYPHAKIIGVEVMGCQFGDTSSFKVFMGGTLLNQFGFNINLPDHRYERISRFDADLYAGLKVVVEFNSVSAKTIGINFIMDEVKE